MKDPYLIQRGTMRIDPSRKGLDGIAAMDYMGAAEFEFGALPNSLKVMRSRQMVMTKTSLKAARGGAIYVISTPEDAPAVIDIVGRLAQGDNGFHLHERTDFSQILRDPKAKIDFWWDVENHWMVTVGEKNAQRVLSVLQ